MNSIDWKATKKGHLFAEVDIKAKKGTKAYSDEIFKTMTVVASQIDDAVTGKLPVEQTDEPDEEDEEDE